MSDDTASDKRPVSETSVRARMPADLKEEAEAIIHDAGLTPSQAIRLYYAHIIRKGYFPFALETDDDD